MASVKYLLIAGFLGVALALAAVGISAAGFQAEAEKSALLAAFPITEKVSSSVNLMLSHRDKGATEVELPNINCTVHFREKYLETEVTRRDATAYYGLYIFEDVTESPHSGPDGDKIKCPDEAGNRSVCIRRTGNSVTVSAIDGGGACG